MTDTTDTTSTTDPSTVVEMFPTEGGAPGVAPNAPQTNTTKKAPPRKRTTRKRPAAKRPAEDKAPRPPGRPSNRDKLESRLDEMFVTVGALVLAFHEPDGTAIIEGSPRLADSLAKLADENPRVRSALERMLTGSAWGGVIVAAAGIALPIMANHGLLPSGLASLPSAAGGDAAPAFDLSGVDLGSLGIPPDVAAAMAGGGSMQEMAARLAGSTSNGDGG